MTALRILLADDDTCFREAVASVLESVGHTVTQAESGEEVLRLLRSSFGSWDVVITDYHMPPPDGAALIRTIAESTGRFGLRGVVLCTAEPPDQPALAVVNALGDSSLIVRYVRKGRDILACLDDALAVMG